MSIGFKSTYILPLLALISTIFLVATLEKYILT